MQGVARLIEDPILVVDLRGRILEMNKRAQALMGPLHQTAKDVFDAESFGNLLAMASGTADPVLGAVTLIGAERPERFRAKAVVTERSATGLKIAIRLLNDREPGFSELTDRIKALNREIAARRSAQARLEEALARNDVLYQELQHRVKNHLQMVLGLIAAARREAGRPEVALTLEAIHRKLESILTAQRLMYSRENASATRALQLLESLAALISNISGKRIDVVCEDTSLELANDVTFPLALIINELLSNAAKYGIVGVDGRASVSLTKARGELLLEVRDNGPGFNEGQPGRMSSGLGLVKGLCRQIGARFHVVNEAGTLVRVEIPHAGRSSIGPGAGLSGERP